MSTEPRVQMRVDPDDLAVLRRLGALAGVSADLVARRVLEAVLPEMRRILEAAEELQAEHDPAGRGYVVWSINFPDGGLTGEDGLTLQPSGGLAVLHVGGETYFRGNVVLVKDPTREQMSARELVMPVATTAHLNLIPTASMAQESVS